MATSYVMKEGCQCTPSDVVQTRYPKVIKWIKSSLSYVLL